MTDTSRYKSSVGYYVSVKIKRCQRKQLVSMHWLCGKSVLNWFKYLSIDLYVKLNILISTCKSAKHSKCLWLLDYNRRALAEAYTICITIQSKINQRFSLDFRRWRFNCQTHQEGCHYWNCYRQICPNTAPAVFLHCFSLYLWCVEHVDSLSRLHLYNQQMLLSKVTHKRRTKQFIK